MTTLSTRLESSQSPEPGSPETALWRVLSEANPTVDSAGIAQCIIDARSAVELFGLDAEQRDAMLEIIAKQQLRLRGGDLASTARLDPEVHKRRI
jgi:hypothetical protein